MTKFQELVQKLLKNPNYEASNDFEKAVIDEAREEAKALAEKNQDEQVSKLADKFADVVANSVAEALKEAGLETNKSHTEKVEDPTDASILKGMKGDAKISKFFELAGSLKDSELKSAGSEMSKDELTVAFFKAVATKNEKIVKALSEGTDEDGGHLVPEEFRMDVVRDLNKRPDAFRRYATVLPMRNKTLELPKVTSEVEVFWGTENTSISTTSADFGNILLTAFRLNAILRTSRELVNDAGVSVVNLITQMFSDAIVRAENKAFMTGNGTGKPKGLNTYSFTTISAANALSWTHLNKVYFRLPESYRANAVWVMNSRTLEGCSNIKDDQNRPVLKEADSGDIQTIKTKPVVEMNDLPSSIILFGAPKFYYVGDREQMSVETSTEEGDTWKKHQLAIKVVERIDGRLALTQAFRKISNTGIS